MTIEEISNYFLLRDSSEYKRSNYDKFIKDKKFSFPTKSIHITGTNGKGSTANFLKNIYKRHYKVGMFMSPFLADVREMISINDEQISLEEFSSLLEEFKKDFDKYSLTSFEIQTFIAYTYFIRKKIDLAIIEVGMGGYIDATNIINPLLSIITSVSLEHTSYLGRSVSEIAESKSGIIKENGLALVGKLSEDAMYAIREHCKDYNAELHIVDDFHNVRHDKDKIIFDYYGLKDIAINTPSEYQLKNASLAIEATRLLSEKIAVTEEDVRAGLADKLLNCRFERFNEHIILDGGHNVEAIGDLVDAITKVIDKPIHIIFAVFKDKNVEQMLVSLSNISEDLTLTTFDHKRARKEEDFFLYLGDYSFEEDYKKLIKEKLEAYPDDIILVTGSLSFTGVVREFLKSNE